MMRPSREGTTRIEPNPVFNSPMKRPASPSTSMALPLTMWEKTMSFTQIQCGGMGSGTDCTLPGGSAAEAAEPHAGPSNDNSDTASAVVLKTPVLDTMFRSNLLVG